MFSKIKDFMFNRKMKKQRYKRGFADEDCWNLDCWMTETLPKMILHLRDMKNGSPDLSFEEYETLPPEWKEAEIAKYNQKQKEKGYSESENSIHTKWYIILTRVAYCLEEADKFKEMYNPYDKEFHEYFWKKDVAIPAELKEKYYKAEEENQEYKEKMKDEAMDLIKKYFYCFWD